MTTRSLTHITAVNARNQASKGMNSAPTGFNRAQDSRPGAGAERSAYTSRPARAAPA